MGEYNIPDFVFSTRPPITVGIYCWSKLTELQLSVDHKMQCTLCKLTDVEDCHNFHRTCEVCGNESTCYTLYSTHASCPHCYQEYDHNPQHTSTNYTSCDKCAHVAPCQNLLRVHQIIHDDDDDLHTSEPTTSNATSNSVQTGGRRRRRSSSPSLGRFTRRKETRGFRFLQRFVNYNYHPGGEPDFFRFLDEVKPVVQMETKDYHIRHGELTYAFPISVSCMYINRVHVTSKVLLFIGHI